MGYSDTECLGVVVSNLLACIRKGNKLVYSRNRNYKPQSSKKNITPYRIIRSIGFLEGRGYVTNHVGESSKQSSMRVVSWVDPTDKFKQEWSDVVVYMQAEIDYLEGCDVIELRDVNKNTVPYRKSDHINRMATTVRQLNQMNESVVVEDKDGSLLTNIYCRIFNESFEFGGRFYRADVLSIKNKKTHDRLKIKIGGQGVCEVDYSNLHFRIAASFEGLDVEDMPLDVYSGILEDEDNLIDREVVKLAVNMMFNCNNEDQARKTIQKEINLMPKESRSNYTLGNALSVMSLVYLAYPQFEHLFCSDSSFGRVLQNADSHLASDIIDLMVERNIPCLPIHDSFIVPLDKLNVLCDTMGDCFRGRFNWTGVVPVGVKYIEGGAVIEQKICV